MKINLNKLFKPFMASYNELSEEFGEDFQRYNGVHNENLNFTDFMDNFMAQGSTVADTTIDSNANNSTRDIRSLMSDMMKPHTKLLAWNKIFYEITKKYGLSTAKAWMREEWTGGMYLHDFSTASYLPYCFAYDLDAVAEKGLFFINRFKTDPPKHLTTFNDHVLEFISWTANRTSGACGLPSYLIYSYYFWKKDVDDGFYLRDPEYYRRQCFQKFIYDLNQPYLRIVECAFTNITVMDRPYMYELFGGRKFPDGSDVVDYVEEIIEHQQVFMEVVSKIRSERMFTFPVLTYSLLYQDGKFVDEEFARWCSDHNTKWCDSNFYVGNDVTSLSSCCRLVNDFSKLEGFINSIGGTSLKIGSVKVNTINLRRVFLEAKAGLDSGVVDEDYYLELLKDKVDLCVKALDCVRGIIARNVEKGLLPNYQDGIIDMNRQFNTIGINGMYETIRDFGYIETDADGNESYTDKGIVFASRILDFISALKDSYGFSYSINVEAVPGERCAAVLSTKDNALYPNDNVGDFLYGNQWIPLGKKCTINEKIRLGAILDRKCGGGQISHINVEGEFNNNDQAWDILNYIASQGVIYFAFNKKISVCSENHAFFGDKCPICGGEKVDEYCRIVGYLVPITSYSKERKKEYDMREWYSLKEWM